MTSYLELRVVRLELEIARQAEQIRALQQDLRTLQQQQRVAQSGVYSGGSAGVSTVAFLGQLDTDGSYPTAAGSFFAVHPVTTTGALSEGSAVIYATDASTTYYVANISTVVPPIGTKVIVTPVDDRYVMDYGACA